MKRDLGCFDRTFDVAIVGGGIFGICAAWDAVLRGLSVALIERDDFGAGASANCFKLIHSGIRHLTHGDIARARLSCRERRILMRLAPHQIQPLPTILPTYGHGRRGPELLLAGMRAFDLIAWDRNRGLREPAQQLPAGRLLSRRELLEAFPFVDARGLNGGGVFYEAQMHSPARLALAFLHSAVDSGAVAANYVEATGLRLAGRRVEGVSARDRLGGTSLEIRARIVVIAAGGASAEIAKRDLGLPSVPAPTFSRDACLVLRRRPYSSAALAVVTGRSFAADAVVTRAGRHLLLAPWGERTLLGVWHSVLADSAGVTPPEPEEVHEFLSEINDACPGLALGMDDVSLCQWGPVLFGAGPQNAGRLRFGKDSLLVDHAARDGVEGLVTLVGVRYTTGRREAERAIDLVLDKLGRSAVRSKTAETPIYGSSEDIEGHRRQALQGRPDGVAEEAIDALVRRHGCEHERVLRVWRDRREPGRPATDADLRRAEVEYAVNDEMALTLEDVVLRRTEIGTAGHPGPEALLHTAREMAGLLGWDDARLRSEIDAVERRFACGGLRVPAAAPETAADGDGSAGMAMS